jgi:hypothetical protein
MRNLILLLPAALGATVQLAATTLYDGGLGTTPDHQGWIYLTDPLSGAAASQAASGGVTTLDSIAVTAEKAGDFGFGLATLDRSTGYTVSLTLKLDSETHTRADRAGFSLIALSSDHHGVELGFWTDQVWAQNAGFTHGESASFATTSASVRYDLTISGSTYSLSVGGASLLNGTLRDYSASGAPYTQNNLLFFGDDTSEAAAKAEVANVTFQPVPEPGPLALLALGTAAGWWRFRQRPTQR